MYGAVPVLPFPVQNTSVLLWYCCKDVNIISLKFRGGRPRFFAAGASATSCVALRFAAAFFGAVGSAGGSILLHVI